ncbi:MAG: RIP metalloprotease RseP [Immundisolibacter sp.]|uniref:RIP metalloprotease RseP n=1 Tax=Immundisolibacter sp. TaxID=1934948 RepID=UPI003D0DF21D
MNVLWSVGAFLVAIGVLVSVHEYGHFWAARRAGVKVLRFSIGFGRPLWRRTDRHGTEFVIAALPLGGYVKMLDEHEAPVPEAQREQAFNRKPVTARMGVVAAGPLANLLLAFVFYWAMFMVGTYGQRPLVGEVLPDTPAAAAGFRAGDALRAVDGRPVRTWEDALLRLMPAAIDGRRVSVDVATDSGTQTRTLDLSGLDYRAEDPDVMRHVGLAWRGPRIVPEVGDVIAGGAAAAAGIVVGDVMLAVDGEPLVDWGDWVRVVREHPQQPLRLRLRRAGSELDITVTPQAVDEDGQRIGRVGLAPKRATVAFDDYYLRLRYGPLDSAGAALGKLRDMTVLTGEVIWRMLTGDASSRNISGPLSIAEFAGQSARLGAAQFLSFLGLVSLSLGLLNLLPVPVLDGGHLLYYAAEWVRGRPLPERLRVLGQQVGLAALLALTVLAFYNDITRLLF